MDYNSSTQVTDNNKWQSPCINTFCFCMKPSVFCSRCQDRLYPIHLSTGRYLPIHLIERPGCVLHMEKAKAGTLTVSSSIELNHLHNNVRFKVGFQSPDHLNSRSICVGLGLRPVLSFKESLNKELALLSREEILEKLKNKLRGDKLYKIKPIPEIEEEFKNTESTQDPTEDLNDRELTILTSGSEFFEQCTESKESSLNAQQLLGRASSSQVLEAANRLDPYLNDLLLDKFGNYVLQKMLNTCEGVRNSISNICIQDFEKLCCNEYASRVMQVLIETHEPFRTASLKFFERNFKLAAEKLTACFLLIACMKTEKNTAFFAFVSENLIQLYSEMTTLKLYQRIAVVYSQYCSEEDLNNLASKVILKDRLISFLNCKFMTSFLVTVIERQYHPLTEMISDMLRTKLKETFRTRFFKYLAIKIFTSRPQPATQRFSSALFNVPSSSLKQWFERKSGMYFYLYVLLISWEVVESPQDKSNLRRKDDRSPKKEDHLIAYKLKLGECLEGFTKQFSKR